jgi:hypothetical protein
MTLTGGQGGNAGRNFSEGAGIQDTVSKLVSTEFGYQNLVTKEVTKDFGCQTLGSQVGSQRIWLPKVWLPKWLPKNPW